MNPKLLAATCGLGWLALAVFPGCSKPPVNWAQPLSGVDRLVVTNQAFAVGETFTGQEAFSVVEAVKSARPKNRWRRLGLGRSSRLADVVYGWNKHPGGCPVLFRNNPTGRRGISRQFGRADVALEEVGIQEITMTPPSLIRVRTMLLRKANHGNDFRKLLPPAPNRNHALELRMSYATVASARRRAGLRF